MEFALVTLTRKLRSTGMSDVEIDSLLAKFLEEEAFNYVDYINYCFYGISPDETEYIH